MGRSMSTIVGEGLHAHPFDGAPDRRRSDRSTLQHGVVPRTQMELDSMEATKKMVEEGLGIALLPRIALERELDAGILRAHVLKNVGTATYRNRIIELKQHGLTTGAPENISLPAPS